MALVSGRAKKEQSARDSGERLHLLVGAVIVSLVRHNVLRLGFLEEKPVERDRGVVCAEHLDRQAVHVVFHHHIQILRADQ